MTGEIRQPLQAPGELVPGKRCYVRPEPVLKGGRTAIVVGVSTTALGLAIVVRIREAYGSIEEEDILEKDVPREESP